MGLDKIPLAAGASLKRPNGDIIVSCHPPRMAAGSPKPEASFKMRSK
jgi:hypothetical protein